LATLNHLPTINHQPSTINQLTAESLLGHIDWQSPTTGYCRCPGLAAHTSPSGPKDCRVSIDGAPTLFCFHQSCAPAIEAVNRQLRQRLVNTPWTLVLPGGKVLRSGGTQQNQLVDGGWLRVEGREKPRVEGGAAFARPEGPAEPRSSFGPAVSARPPYHQPSTINHQLLDGIAQEMTRRRMEILDEFRWPYASIMEDSPLQTTHRSPQEQFALWLKLWPAHATIWIGDVFHSGKPEYSSHFRSIADWSQLGPVMGNFTCGCAFRPGTFSRSDDSIEARHFLIVESDTLTRDEVGAVFLYLKRRLHYRLHCIIDTAGKSLHGWFTPPPARLQPGLKKALTALGCDPKLFTPSQPVRIPGAHREGRLQRLIWIRD